MWQFDARSFQKLFKLLTVQGWLKIEIRGRKPGLYKDVQTFGMKYKKLGTKTKKYKKFSYFKQQSTMTKTYKTLLKVK
jgi:hypothetical protein